MKNYALSLSFFILIFLFLIFACTNLGFMFGLSINLSYIFISLIIALIILYKSGNFFKKTAVLFLIFLFSLIFANFFIDTSFDGRCYHFTIENLFKLGYNPYFSDIKTFADKNGIYYNLLFASSYPNALEVLRANFYLLFQNMESSKIVNFLLLTSACLYSFYFFNFKLNKLKSFILSLCTIFCAVSICQINTKMADFFIYFLFMFELMSLYLTDKKKDIKINTTIFIISSALSVAAKYTGLLNTVIISFCYLIFKRKKIKETIKTFSIVIILCLILCAQPYFTNLARYKNPFYPSIGQNKLDFMTKQNPREFINKPYIYKFFKSMFSSASDSRISNPETLPLFYKIPFTSHFDMPYVSEDVRVNGFGHLFSGIFIISVILTIYLFKKRRGIFPISTIFISTLLNPLCWWARFVPQLHLLPIFVCYYFRKNNYIFYILSFLIIFNGLWILKENFSVSAYKTYVMNNYYNELYKKDEILIYKDKTPRDEEDETIIPRLIEYGVNFKIVEKFDESFEKINSDCTIAKSYRIKTN